jgi:hypothetical protein
MLYYLRKQNKRKKEGDKNMSVAQTFTFILFTIVAFLIGYLSGYTTPKNYWRTKQ